MRVTAVNGQAVKSLTPKEVGATVLQSSSNGRCRLSLVQDEESYTKVVMMLRSLNDADDSDEEEDYIYNEAALLSTVNGRQCGQQQPTDYQQEHPSNTKQLFTHTAAPRASMVAGRPVPSVPPRRIHEVSQKQESLYEQPCSVQPQTYEDAKIAKSLKSPVRGKTHEHVNIYEKPTPILPHSSKVSGMTEGQHANSVPDYEEIEDMPAYDELQPDDYG